MAKGRGKTRVVILGGGFGGVFTAYHLDRLHRDRDGMQVTLINRDNYYLMTPLLFEASSGVLEPRHVVNPIRPLLRRAQFVEAEIERVDFDGRTVYAQLAEGEAPHAFPYDHLVIAVGGVSNQRAIPGAEHALTFKTLADAIYLRNHIIDVCERADVETDPYKKRELLTFVVVGGGLVGVELMGELQEFIADLCQTYKRIRCNEPQFYLLDHGDRIMSELPEDLSEYAAHLFRKRGIRIFTHTSVTRLEPGAVHLPDEQCLPTRTILLATGVIPSPLTQDFPLAKDRKGRIITDGTMNVPDHPEVWALGDCAAVPDPTGKTYTTLAQNAIRQAKVLAQNITAALQGRPRQPFVYRSRGMLAALGHYSGVGEVFGFKIRGFLAWWVWRTYYLLQMSRDRRIRIVLDWTLELFFKHDIVKLDLFGQEHPLRHSARQRRIGPGGRAEPAGATETPPLPGEREEAKVG